MNILEQICDDQLELVKKLSKERPIEELKKSKYYDREVISLKKKFGKDAVGIIAEFKRRSPSKPNINLGAVSTEIVPGYEKAGAFASSILTNEKYFGGTESDLTSVRELVNIPLLRKDFIVDPYQVHETKAMGADIILLIAAALGREETYELAKLAKQLGLEVLLELKSLDEIRHVNPYVDLVGVNNRDLSTFEVKISTSEVLSFAIPEGAIRISESGLKDPATVKRLENYGFQGFLMGEHFMDQADPVKACADFVASIQG